MKKFFLLALLAVGCTTQKYGYDVIRKTPEQKLTPPGTVWLKDNLFIDETEVTNFGWVEYMYSMGRIDPAGYKTTFTDTACWARADIGFNTSNPLVTYYLRYPAYKEYPVVGVSYSQAVAFCEWRSRLSNVFLYLKDNKNIKFNPDSVDSYAKRAPQKIKFRLPTAEEWEYAAAAGLNYRSYPMGYESLTDSKGKPANNTLEYYILYSKTFTLSDTIPATEPTLPVYSGKPNRYGLYQMLGNVSELVADSLVKGLNFSAPIYSINREQTEDETYLINTKTYNYKLSEKYTQPEPWIGFRCIAEVLEK